MRIPRTAICLLCSMPYLNAHVSLKHNNLQLSKIKGEISATDAANMFRNLAKSDLADDTPIASVARKLANRVLKARECPRPEIALSLQGLPLYRSSMKVDHSC